MARKKKTESVTVRLPSDVLANMREVVAATGWNMSRVIVHQLRFTAAVLASDRAAVKRLQIEALEAASVHALEVQHGVDVKLAKAALRQGGVAVGGDDILQGWVEQDDLADQVKRASKRGRRAV